MLLVDVDDSSVEIRKKIAGHEPLESILRWLSEVELGNVADLLRDEEAELVDITTFPPRPLTSWSKTVQASGLWPSARLSVRRVSRVDLTVKASNGTETFASRMAARIDEKWNQVAARAFFTFPSRAFVKDVPSSEASRCRLVYNGEILPAERSVGSSSLPREGAVLVLCGPPPTKTPPRGTCRICLCEEDVAASSRQESEDDLWPSRVYEALGRLARGQRVDWSSVAPRPAPDRLFSPCHCSGSMRYVHVSCLQKWRASAPRTQSRFRCDQCGYRYRLKRTALASFLSSEMGAISVAVAILAVAIQIVGLGLHKFLSPATKRAFYRSLRLRQFSPQFVHIACLGSAGLGLACFALYALDHLLVAAYYYVVLRRRRGWRVQRHNFAEPTVFLFVWIVAELRDLRRSRALAVVGFIVCGRLVFSAAVRVARVVALKLGESVLDVPPKAESTTTAERAHPFSVVRR